MENPDDAKTIINKVILACHARNASKKLGKVSPKTELIMGNIWGKLSEYKIKDVSDFSFSLG